ncbi:MAG: TlpA family protein disulfide reductase [Betaproteobacteria bacterium HGW-Betaproteobacteria-20]|jgi:thiol-disulfide isomerase/thioredoxin|nr:MAG: TlpA family protein disulfide reductase [Betaproteobacteria bacterium HGW-Betaproteobacteria-20]
MKFIPLIFCCCLIAACNEPANTTGEVEIGSILRDIPMNSFTGDIRKFSAYRGKPLIINVWASWCGPCRAEMASLEQLSNRFNGKQFNIIGISTDDNASAAAVAIKQSKLTFANYLDHDVMLENMLGASSIPLTILVDAYGRVLLKVRGSREWDSPESLRLIEQTFHIKLE